jgi:hypothetical protein
MRGVRASAQLDAPAVLCLAAAVWSETYVASLRTRLDVALYMAIACSTGLGSAQLLGESGVRWRDIALWMAANGPQALLISQTFRPYRLTDGRCLSLAAAKLVAIGMYLDGAIAGALSLRDLLSTAYRGSETAERQVLLHVDR